MSSARHSIYKYCSLYTLLFVSRDCVRLCVRIFVVEQLEFHKYFNDTISHYFYSRNAQKYVYTKRGKTMQYNQSALKMQLKLSSVRSRMLNEEIIGKYFDDLSKLITSLNLEPHQLWNVDETGFNFEHSPVKAVAERGQRNVVNKVTRRSNNITVMASVNAHG